MIGCTKCKREFPDHLTSPMAISENGQLRYQTVCPICAIEIMNETHKEPTKEKA